MNYHKAVKREKINHIIKSFSEAKITKASKFETCDVIAVMDREEPDVIYFADKNDCEKDNETSDEKIVLKTCNENLREFDFFCFFKINNEKYKEKLCRRIIFF